MAAGTLADLDDAPLVPRLSTAVVRRLDEVVWGTLPLAVVSVMAIGAAMADQAGRQAMRLLGDQSFIGLEYPVLGVQEFCPLIVAVVLALRVGAGVAAELGALRADETLDALTVLGLSPVRARVTPILFALPIGAVILTLPCLVAWETAGVLVMLARSGINPFTFVHPEVITPPLLALAAVKAAAAGAAIGIGAVTAALEDAARARTVGEIVTRGVVRGTLLALFVNLVLDVWWFLS